MTQDPPTIIFQQETSCSSAFCFKSSNKLEVVCGCLFLQASPFRLTSVSGYVSRDRRHVGRDSSGQARGSVGGLEGRGSRGGESRGGRAAHPGRVRGGRRRRAARRSHRRHLRLRVVQDTAAPAIRKCTIGVGFVQALPRPAPQHANVFGALGTSASESDLSAHL